jgi:hypothetical protein
MGIMNLLKANWTGKVGQTVGAKWKNKSTIRSYTKPAYTNTPAQQIIRQGFKEVSSYLALFTDQIKSFSAINTKGMSVRNALLSINKDMITSGALDPASLIVSKGGLPVLSGVTASVAANHQSLTAAWTAVTGATISERAKVVVIAVNQDANFALTGTALNTAETITLSGQIPSGVDLQVYAYVLDYRGSSKVASVSIHQTIASP